MQRNESASKRRLAAVGGFTLVELLVTITIIVLLVGITMPTFQAVRESARRTQCINNIRQVGQAIVGYDSATSTLPGWRNRVGTYPSTTSWTVPILPQLGNQEAYDWFDKYDASAAPINNGSENSQNWLSVSGSRPSTRTLIASPTPSWSEPAPESPLLAPSSSIAPRTTLVLPAVTTSSLFTR